MSLTPSTMSPLGSVAPVFKLLDPKTGGKITIDVARGDKGLLVMFICNHCPYVIHLEKALIDLGLSYQNSGLGIVAISANDVVNYPQDAPELMAKKEYCFPYLYDEDQSVAKAYDAACTPDFFLYDANLQLVYRGQFDDSRPNGSTPITGADLKDAMDLVIAEKSIASDQTPSVGCNIKWKS
ncbi:MAG: thioredoxin family protein [Pseudomonadales bacterium]|nr:thioredoxin family protein [Pseudomonadales bacterium]